MIHVVGIVGVPNTYGGFEALAEHLLDSPMLINHGIRIYSEASLVEIQGRYYKGAELIPLRWRANGWQSILFDSSALFRASFSGGVVLILGTSATFWLPILRRLFPGVRYIVNMAGLEWTRSKWSILARHFLKYNEAIAARYAHVFIADNQGLVEYISSAYGCKATLITYGGDQFEDAVPDQSIFSMYSLPEHYDFAMARAQVDNNIQMILDAYVATGLPLVFVSNWDSSSFGRALRKRYAVHSNIHLIGPVYDVAKVKALHQRVRLYVHGHSAGGTNPVLVEAMWAGLPTIAFDVTFNRYTTHGYAFYFSNVDELVTYTTNLTKRNLEDCKMQLRRVAVENYKWNKVQKDYEHIILSVGYI